MEKATLVLHSDLLGFGNLVASANGTFSSPVGKSAFRRVELLRTALFECEKLFPADTVFFQLNDLVVACLDLDVDVSSMTIDAASISSRPIGEFESKNILQFISAAASFHQKTLNYENTEQLGQGPRSFIVLGKRWEISSKPVGSRIVDTPQLQANMAFAEAYQGDSLGSSAGFKGSAWDRLFINDYLWHLLIGISCPAARQLAKLPADILKRLDSLGIPGGMFPDNLVRNGKINVSIFHRERQFVPLMSHHACEIQSQVDGS
jgi:hypothetical protein